MKIDEVIYIPILIYTAQSGRVEVNIGAGDSSDGHLIGYKTKKQAWDKIDLIKKKDPNLKDLQFEVLSYKKVS